MANAVRVTVSLGHHYANAAPVALLLIQVPPPIVAALVNHPPALLHLNAVRVTQSVLNSVALVVTRVKGNNHCRVLQLFPDMHNNVTVLVCVFH